MFLTARQGELMVQANRSQGDIMDNDRLHAQESVHIKNVCAKAGMWCLLMIGLLAVCVSLPMMALAF